MNRKTRKEEMYEAIIKHGRNLNMIFGTDHDGITLCKKLRLLEIAAHKIAEYNCNIGYASEAEEDIQTGKILDKVDKILSFRKAGVPVFLNLDARGYALKINDNWMRKNKVVDLEKDWGGYGIIAPDFRVGGKW